MDKTDQFILGGLLIGLSLGVPFGLSLAHYVGDVSAALIALTLGATTYLFTPGRREMDF